MSKDKEKGKEKQLSIVKQGKSVAKWVWGGTQSNTMWLIYTLGTMVAASML